MKKINKKEIIKILQQKNLIGDWWNLESFFIYETEEKIIFSYNHGDMGTVDKIKFYKKDNYVEIYELDNYYGGTYLCNSLYL